MRWARKFHDIQKLYLVKIIPFVNLIQFSAGIVKFSAFQISIRTENVLLN